VLSRAHEREFGEISENNRPIWMLADAAEAGSHDGKSNEGIPSDNPAFCTLAAHGICNETRESFFRGEIYQSGGFLGGIFGIKNHFAL